MQLRDVLDQTIQYQQQSGITLLVHLMEHGCDYIAMEQKLELLSTCLEQH